MNRRSTDNPLENHSPERLTCPFHNQQADSLKELDTDMKELARAIAAGLKEVNDTVSKKVSMALFVWIVGIIIAILGSNFGLWVRNLEGYAKLVTKEDFMHYREEREQRLKGIEEKIDYLSERVRK